MKVKAQPSIKILLADDDKDDRFLFDLALKKLSVVPDLKSVPDGERLLTYLSANSETLPDILFLDLNMPRKNGSECLVEIKRQEKLKHIPVIIYSTSIPPSIADILHENGAHYYLQKCDYPGLVICLQKIFDKLAVNPDQPSRDNFMIN